jgi:peptide/nickel transport system substrate-binding protein
MRKTFISLILIGLLFVSCSKGKKEESKSVGEKKNYSAMTTISLPEYQGKTPEIGGTFRRSIPSDPVTLNPVVASDMTSYLVYKWIFDPLFDMDKEMNIIPVLVDSYKFSNDSLTLTLYLKKNVKWNDEKPFTADDVLFTFDTINDNSVEAINKRFAFEKVKNYKKIDDYTIEINYKEPYASAIFDLVLYVVPKHIYNYPQGKGEMFNSHPQNNTPIGNGPFKFVKWQRGESVTLKANEEYYNGRPKIDDLVLKVMPLAETEYSAFVTNSLDLTRLTPEMWDEAISNSTFKDSAYLLEFPSRQYFYIGWNGDGSNPFFSDKNIRKAMTYAINREAFINVILKKHALPCTGPFYPGSDDCDPEVKPLPYDPEMASKLLDEAGFKDSNGNGIRDKNGVEFEFECIYPQVSRDYERFLEFFSADLKRVGIKMKLAPVEWAIFLKRTNSHKFESFLSGYSYGDDPNPFMMYHSSMAELLPSGEGKGANDVSYKNLEVDKLIEEQMKETDPQRRKVILRKIHKIIYDDQPYTYLVVPNNLAALKNKFQNVELSQKGYGLFTFYPALLNWWVPKELR